MPIGLRANRKKKVENEKGVVGATPPSRMKKGRATADEMVEKILARYGTTREEAERKLRRLYEELNAEKFNHELPDRPLIRISFETRGAMATFKDIPLVSIYVAPFCDPAGYRRVMFHEMTHYFAADHGEAFQAKLAQVAHGEPWLDDELEKCCGPWVVHDRIKNGWIKIVVDLSERYPTLSSTQARSLAAKQLGCSVSEMRDALGTQFETEWHWWIERRKNR